MATISGGESSVTEVHTRDLPDLHIQHVILLEGSWATQTIIFQILASNVMVFIRRRFLNDHESVSEVLYLWWMGMTKA